MLKGTGMVELVPELWPMLLFLALAGGVALLRYRRTVD
jgi:ABC-2 type transport system permease protein